MQGPRNPLAAFPPRGDGPGRAVPASDVALGQSAAQFVAAVIRQRILDGSLPAGECLRQ